MTHNQKRGGSSKEANLEGLLGTSRFSLHGVGVPNFPASPRLQTVKLCLVLPGPLENWTSVREATDPLPPFGGQTKKNNQKELTICPPLVGKSPEAGRTPPSSAALCERHPEVSRRLGGFITGRAPRRRGVGGLSLGLESGSGSGTCLEGGCLEYRCGHGSKSCTPSEHPNPH